MDVDDQVIRGRDGDSYARLQRERMAGPTFRSQPIDVCEEPNSYQFLSCRAWDAFTVLTIQREIKANITKDGYSKGLLPFTFAVHHVDMTEKEPYQQMVNPSVAGWRWKFGKGQGGKEVISLTGYRADLRLFEKGGSYHYPHFDAGLSLFHAAPSRHS